MSGAGGQRGSGAATAHRPPVGSWSSLPRGPAAPLSLLAALCALLTLPIAGCEETGARPTATLQAPDSADQLLEGFSHYVTNEGVRRTRVEADTAYFYESSQVTELRDIKVTFYDLQGEEGSTLTAKRGTYRWQDGSMEANDDVVVVSPDGRRLTTEALRYDNATNTISTDQRFNFDRGTEHLEGNSFRSDPDFKNVVTDRPRGVAGDGLLLPGQDGEQ
ncbi:MAG: LPS export ABC transporter periplasmic protein LptC [Gemmatimonadales bacterium]|nr:LPS export ABC transporter periplasmic protein LptC [Gemmatimonadales bacterium]